MVFRFRVRSFPWVALLPLVLLLSPQGVFAQEPPAPLELAPCEIPGYDGEARCGTYEVFEDRQARAGRRIPLKVVVLPATGPEPRPDPVVYFAGGPGASTVGMAPGLAQIDAGALVNRDFLLVDYRGTGGSHPLFCPYQEERSQGIAEALETFLPVDRLAECVEVLGEKADLSQYTMPHIVDDVAEVARALGYERLNLSGGSYGSRAVQVFLRRHPERVRTAFLQGVTPTDARLPVTFAADAQAAVDGWFRECAEDPACHGAFPDPVGDLARVLAELEAADASPEGPKIVEVLDPGSGETVPVRLSRNAFVQTLRYLLYGSRSALVIPAFVHAAAEGDWRPMAESAYSIAGALMASIPDGLYLSVTCTEDVARIGPNAAAVQRGFLGDFRLRQQVAACEEWVTGELPAGFHEPVHSAAPVLLVSGERDPVTPPRWAYDVQEWLPESAHLVIPDGSHGSFGLEGVECVTRLWEQLLETASVAGLDVAACAAAIERPPFLVEIPDETAEEDAQEPAEGRAAKGRLEALGFPIRQVLDVGRAPHQISFSADGRRAFIAAAGSDRITEVAIPGDPSEPLAVAGHREVAGTPLGVVELPAGGDLAVTLFRGGAIVRLPAAGGGPVERLDTGAAPSLLVGPVPGRGGHPLYLVATEGVDLLHVLDGATFELREPVPVGDRPFPPAATSDGRKAFVPGYDDGSVTVVDLHAGEVLATVTVGERPSGGVVLPGDTVYAAAVRGEDAVAFVDTVTHRVVGKLTEGIGEEPFSVVPSPDGRLAFVNNTASHNVSVIRLGERWQDHEVIARLPVGEIPIVMAVHPDGETLWVGCEGSHELWVVGIPGDR